MSTFDRILHIVGLAAGGIVAAGASGGIAVPAWLMITAGVVAYVAPANAAKLTLPGMKGPQTGVGAGAKNQAVDPENPK